MQRTSALKWWASLGRTVVLAISASAGLASGQVNVVVRLVDQNQVDIPDSVVEVPSLGLSIGTGGSLNLPEGMHTFRLVPGVGGMVASAGHLQRSAAAEVTATTSELVFSWPMSLVQINLVDQHGAPIVGVSGQPSVFRFRTRDFTFVSGTVLSLPITDETELSSSSLLGIYADGYDLVMAPAIFSIDPIPGNVDLARSEVSGTTEVRTATTTLDLVWPVQQVQLNVVDQYGVPLTGNDGLASQFMLSRSALLVDNGGVVSLPITDEAAFPAPLMGAYANGYDFRILPGILDFPRQMNWFSYWIDSGTTEVDQATIDLTFTWPVQDVVLNMFDEDGLTITGDAGQVGVFKNAASQIVFPSGSAVPLPVTDDADLPDGGRLVGSQSDGYDIIMAVPYLENQPITGNFTLNRAERTDTTEVSLGTASLDFVWPVREVQLNIVDQYGVPIIGTSGQPSRFNIWHGGTRIDSGTVVSLPITDQSYFTSPNVVFLGSFWDGYDMTLEPAFGQNFPGQVLIIRHELSDVTEVHLDTTEITHEWIQVSCAIQLVNANLEPVPGSTLRAWWGQNFYPGETYVFPITDDSLYPHLTGVSRDGHPIYVTPGDQPSLTELFRFETYSCGLDCGTFEPSSFEIGGNTYSLICAENRPPIPDAGSNRIITSAEQFYATVNGSASDPDGDAMTYRWLEDGFEVQASLPVGGAGEAALDLAALPTLATGNHTFVLEVSDLLATASDSMVLTVENSPPEVITSGEMVVQVGAEIVLHGTVADFDGDAVQYTWSEGSTVLATGTLATVVGGQPVGVPPYTIPEGLDLGNHTLTLTVEDGVSSPVTSSVDVTVIDTDAPTLTPVASPAMLWPPNRQMVDVVIDLGASDNSGGPLTYTVEVTSNEDPKKDNQGNTIPDWTDPVIDEISGTLTLSLRAARYGKGTGRIYTIRITVEDASGNATTTSIELVCAHDRGGQ